jgi:hypothetical protein
VIVFVGTLSQVDLGIYYAQKKYFQSFFVFHDFGPFSLPILPGGYLLGWLFTINLVAAMTVRMKWTKKKLGLLITHIGLLVLVVGSGLAGAITTESQMAVEEGDTMHYSQHLRYSELAITDTSHPDHNVVTVIPDKILSKETLLQNENLPFDVNVIKYYPNAQLAMQPFAELYKTPEITEDIGAKMYVKPLEVFVRDDLRNNTSVIVEFIEKETRNSMGTWLFSLDLVSAQIVELNGKNYELNLRPIRYYNPYSITLNDFSHDKYPGTDIPKNFSSAVTLEYKDTGEKRDTLIYMNHPLRIDGKTYYQASFASNNTISIFQVVDNPLWQLPYFACLLITIGMTLLFITHFLSFLARRKEKNA